MKNEILLVHKFVEFIPRELEVNVIYISIPYATAIHNCCCGCGNRVVTPISPAGWKLIFDGRTISLEPSIGNWRYACRSHYWIENNRVIWANEWEGASAAEMSKKHKKPEPTNEELGKRSRKNAKSGLRRRIKNWLGLNDPTE
jgi:hypothetical protein